MWASGESAGDGSTKEEEKGRSLFVDIKQNYPGYQTPGKQCKGECAYDLYIDCCGDRTHTQKREWTNTAGTN